MTERVHLPTPVTPCQDSARVAKASRVDDVIAVTEGRLAICHIVSLVVNVGPIGITP